MPFLTDQLANIDLRNPAQMLRPCLRTSVNHVSGLDTQREREEERPQIRGSGAFCEGLGGGWCGCLGSLGLGFLLLDLDEVAAGVVEDRGDDGPEVGWGLDEFHTCCHETLVFGLHVVDGEGGAGDSVRHNRLQVRTDRGMGVWLKQKLGTFRYLPGSGDTTVIQAYSPRGMLCLSWKPSVSV